MKRLFPNLIPIAACLAMSVAVPSCVDKDYDLAEDIDLTVEAGGDLTLPASNTDVLRLSQILDLDSESSIREAEQGEYGLSAGDYVLVQSGTPTETEFHIGEVAISNLSSSTASSGEIEFVNVDAGAVTMPASPTVNSFDITDDNVTPDLVSISGADMDVRLACTLAYTSSTGYNGDIIINEGYTISFDPAWTVEVMEAEAGLLSNASHNVIRFDRAYTLNAESRLLVKFRLVHVDLSDVGEGQGLYERGHFALNSSLEMNGDVTLEGWGGAPVGSVEKINIVGATDVESAAITGVTAVVDPTINVSDTEFAIKNIPDFLNDEENSLDISNPRLYISVANNSPVEAELNGCLASYSDDAPGAPIAKVNIGAAYGTDAIIVAGNGTTDILLSQEPIAGADAHNVVVPGLSELLKRIPDYLRLQDVDCRATGREVSIALAPIYSIATEYEAVIPLAFGSDMRLHYTHDEADWDVEDLDKYNVKEVHVTFSAKNTIPLAMTPEVRALDRNKQEISNVTATVTGNVAPGTESSPAVGELTVVLRSTGGNLGNLDGVRLMFDAVSDATFAGINLNANQNLTFSDIRIKIVGGVTIDLND